MAGLRLFTVLVLPALAYTQSQAVLLDRSGSMKPFYDNGLVLQLAREILDSSPGQMPVKLYAFGTTVSRIASLKELTAIPYGMDTYLDRAVKRPIDDGDAIVWLVTDNIEDRPEDGSAGNTEAFYRILRGSAVRKVVICPYNVSPGTTGIAIYGLLLSDKADSIFERELQGFLAIGRGERHLEGLRMKPLDKETVKVVLQDAANSKPLVFDEGVEVSHSVRITFQSRFQHLRIADSTVRATAAEATFAPKSLLTPEKRVADINPKRVRDLPPGGETSDKYEVAVNLGPVHLKPGLMTLIRAATGSSEEIELPVPLEIEVPAEQFRFKRSFLDAYHAGTMQEAQASGKIYGLDKLPILLSEGATKIETEVPFRFRVKYPRRAAIQVLFLGAGLLAALGAVLGGIVILGRRAFNRAEWEPVVTTSYGAPVQSQMGSNGDLAADGAPLGAIRRGSFVPADGVELEAGGEKAEITEDARVGAKRGRESYIVSFKKKGASGGDGAAGAASPQER